VVDDVLVVPWEKVICDNHFCIFLCKVVYISIGMM
jgi:hypothetical protein